MKKMEHVPEFEGRCLCGATRFRVAGEAANRCYCHCRSCRLASGAPFVAWATFSTQAFRLVQGTLAQHRSSAQVQRGFCAACGTAMTYAHDARSSELDVALATLEDAARIAPQYHIWVSHQLPWVQINDGLPRYPEWRSDPA